MAAISDPNFAKVVVRGCSSRREGWINNEERCRKGREEKEKEGRMGRELTAGRRHTNLAHFLLAELN